MPDSASHPGRRRRGRPPRDHAGPPTSALILEQATRLFAERGHDGVSMRSIADSVGIDVSSVHHHYATKAELYDACFRRVFEAEHEHLAPAVDALCAVAEEGTAAEFVHALQGLVDAFVEFLETHPSTTFLWLRRWLDPGQHEPLDAAYALPIYHRVEQALLDAAARGLVTEPTPHVTVRSLVWAAHGHVTALVASGPGHSAAAARETREFGAFARRFVDRMYPVAARDTDHTSR